MLASGWVGNAQKLIHIVHECFILTMGKTKSNGLKQIFAMVRFNVLIWKPSRSFENKDYRTEGSVTITEENSLLHEILANSFFRDFGRVIFCDTCLNFRKCGQLWICLMHFLYKSSHFFFATSNYRDSKSQKNSCKTWMNHY